MFNFENPGKVLFPTILIVLSAFNFGIIESAQAAKTDRIMIAAAAQRIDAKSCKNTTAGKKLTALKNKSVAVPGTAYLINLAAPSGKHQFALIACDKVGAPAKGHTFTLYDLNKGILEHGDQVVLKGPHGLLLGLDKSGQLVADRLKYATREVFTIEKRVKPKSKLAKNDGIAFLTHDRKYIVASGSGGADVKVGTNKKSKTDLFKVTKLDKPLASKAKDLASSGAKKAGTWIAKTIITKAFGTSVAEKLFGKPGEKKKSIVQVEPKACAQDLAKVDIPKEADEADAAGKDKAKKDSKVKAALKKVWAKIDKYQSCGKLKLAITLPKTDLGMKVFYAREKGHELPLWNIALMAGNKTINDNPLTRALPAIKEVTGGLKLTKFVVVLSEDKATVKLSDLGDALSKHLDEHQNSIEIPGVFSSTQQKKGTITLQQGVNLFGEVAGPKKGPLAVLSEAALPGSTRSDEPWKLAGVLGTDFMQKLLSKISSFERVVPPTYSDKKALRAEIWLPGYLPFPYNLINNKKAVHGEISKAQFVFDLSKSKTKKGATKKLQLSAKSWAKYWIFGSKAFPIESQGNITFESGKVAGAINGLYAIKKEDNPLKFIPGVHLTKLRVGGALTHEDKKKDTKTAKDVSAKDTLSAKLASELVVAGETLTSTFDMIVAKKGAKIALEEIRLSLHGAGKDGKIRLAEMGLLGKIPLVNELVLEKGVVGITPTKGIPDFYITGGGTWTRTNMGGQLAVMKKKLKGKEEFFIFTRANDFTLAGLLPKDKKFDPARGVLTALKMPKTLLMFTTFKGSDAEIKQNEIPKPLHAMFTGLVSTTDPRVPIFGDGLTVVTALDFTATENAAIKRGFSQLGFSSFGPQGPLLAAASVGGLQSGKLSLSMAAMLPGFKIPEKLPGGIVNPIGLLFEPKGVDFFLNLVAADAPKVELGVKGKLGLKMPPIGGGKADPLDLAGRLFLKASSAGEIAIQMAGQMKGEWKNPMGIGNLAYKNVAATTSIGVLAAAASVDVGFGGTTIFDIKDEKGKAKRLTMDTDLLVGVGITPSPPWVVPTKLGINFAADELSPDKTIRVADALIKGVLTGPMAKTILNPPPPFKPLPANLRKGIANLQKEINKASLPDLLKLDSLPLPLVVLKPARGTKKVRIYFQTPGAEIPGREESGLKGLGFSVAGAASLRFLGKEQKFGETDLTLTATDGFRLYGQVEPFKVGPLQIGRSGLKPEVDVKASLAGSHFKMKGYLELPPILKDETDIELSKDRIAFHFKKKLGNIFDFEFDAHTEGKDVLSSRKFLLNAKVANNVDTFVKDQVLPRVGVPGPIIGLLERSNPLVVRKLSVKGDMAAFVSGTDKVSVNMTPVFFGDEVKPISAKVKGIDWKHPERNILLGHEVTGAVAVSMINYLVDNPKQTPAFKLGPLLAFDSGYLGGFRVCRRGLSGGALLSCKRLVAKERKFQICRDVYRIAKRTASKAEIAAKCGGLGAKEKTAITSVTDKGFLLTGGIHSVLSKPRARAEFLRGKMDLRFTDDVLNGLIKSDFHAVGTTQNGVPKKLTFDAVVTGDLNKWFRDQVIGKLIKGPVGEYLKKKIKEIDLVTVTKGTFHGDFESFFIKHQPANLNVTVRVLGYDKKRTKIVKGTIPIYDHPKYVGKTIAGSVGLVGHVVSILWRNAIHDIGMVADRVAGDLDRLLGGGGKTGWFVLQDQGSKKCVAPERNARKPGTRIVRTNCDPANQNQQWRFEYKALKAVKLRHRASNLCWDMRMTGIFYSIHNGAPLQLAHCKGNAHISGLNQRFWLRPMDRKHAIVALYPTSAMLHCVDVNPKTGKTHQWLCRLPPAQNQRFKVVPPN